ncbi:hypothetical protein OUZ56_030960 [Daphnia magna]|uniref:Uncharacterized protein n=1 Tax=Daphnia magna TaxID=35525 RepID=A0ABQ9ZST3_9CRUS|nr:hypothetical protein OUZ56_030960 [Daphnia magna]
MQTPNVHCTSGELCVYIIQRHASYTLGQGALKRIRPLALTKIPLGTKLEMLLQEIRTICTMRCKAREARNWAYSDESRKDGPPPHLFKIQQFFFVKEWHPLDQRQKANGMLVTTWGPTDKT